MQANKKTSGLTMVTGVFVLFCQQLKERIKADTLEAIQVKIWETGIAWAAYREEV